MASPQSNGSVKLGSYLKKLRSGYGYSLRRVEERARAEGGEIDNSQLSRYEKGICYPSFDKLRVLASVFNVSIQSFSDIVDLEVYEDMRPEGENPTHNIDAGLDALKAGEPGRAFACFEAALEQLHGTHADDVSRRELPRARLAQAIALTRLGKLSLAEQKLRYTLRERQFLTMEEQARAMLALANIHGDLGDLTLAEMEADRAHSFAIHDKNESLAARALHTRARVLAAQGQQDEAIRCYRQAAEIYDRLGEDFFKLQSTIQIGGCFVERGKTREALRILRDALDQARSGGYCRLAALSWSNMGTAYFKTGNMLHAMKCFRESDMLSQRGEEKHTDLLFYNAYYQWQIGRNEHNPTREKIAFGRMKGLRSSLERRFAELDAFDAFVEGGRKHA